MYVYLIKQENNDLYKVGVSKNPERRLKQLQMNNPNKLILLEIWKSEWSWKIETWFKNCWKHYQIHGEWFQLNFDDTQKEFIDRCKINEENWNIIKQEDPFLF